MHQTYNRQGKMNVTYVCLLIYARKEEKKMYNFLNETTVNGSLLRRI